MSDYIERGAALSEASSAHSADDAYDRIKDIQAADVEPAMRGEWAWEAPYMVCSNCKRHSINRFRSAFCQHCGAKMSNPRNAHMDETP